MRRHVLTLLTVTGLLVAACGDVAGGAPATSSTTSTTIGSVFEPDGPVLYYEVAGGIAGETFVALQVNGDGTGHLRRLGQDDQDVAVDPQRVLALLRDLQSKGLSGLDPEQAADGLADGTTVSLRAAAGPGWEWVDVSWYGVLEVPEAFGDAERDVVATVAAFIDEVAPAG